MLSEKKKMKDLLCEGLYLLMREKPFEKITIKQICDRTGVIRGTFYNHFMDKYEALEYLIQSMFYDNVKSFELDVVFKNIFYTVNTYGDFFKDCFKITGQNGFEELLQNTFRDLFNQLLDTLDMSQVDPMFTKEFLADYYANSTIYFIKRWINENFKTNYEEYYALIQATFINSLDSFKITK